MILQNICKLLSEFLQNIWRNLIRIIHDFAKYLLMTWIPTKLLKASHWDFFSQQFALPYRSGSESLNSIQRSPKYQGRIIFMFGLLFFSQNIMMLEKLSLFSKIPHKLIVFQGIYDYHLILGHKQRLKQVESCFMIPWPSFDTHQTYNCAMIREVLRV